MAKATTSATRSTEASMRRPSAAPDIGTLEQGFEILTAAWDGMRVVVLLAIAASLTISTAEAATGRDTATFTSEHPAVVSGVVTAASPAGVALARADAVWKAVVDGAGSVEVSRVVRHVVRTPTGDVAAEPTVERQTYAFSHGVRFVPSSPDSMVLGAGAGGSVSATWDPGSTVVVGPSAAPFRVVYGGHGRSGFAEEVDAGALVARADVVVLPKGARLFATGVEIVLDDRQHVVVHDADPPGGPLDHEDAYAFATIVASDATARLADADVALPSARVRIDGTLEVANATGTLAAADTERRFQDRAVHFEGLLDLTFARSDGGLSLVAFEMTRTYTVEGRFAAFRVGDGPLVTVDPVAVVAGAVGVTLVSAALAALYTRLTRGLVTGSAARRFLLAEVARAPGLHLRGLQRRTGMGWGRFHYHLRVLRRSGLVVIEPSGRHVRVRPPGVAGSLAAELAPRGAAAQIHAHLVSRGPLAQHDIGRALGLSAQLVSHHVRALEREGRLVRQPGWPPRFAVASSN